MATAVASELESINPATLARVGSVPRTPPELVAEIAAEARLAQERWARTSLRERARLLADVAAVVLARLDEIAETVSAETGKPVLEAITSDLFAAIDSLAWTARHAPKVLAPERVAMPQLFLKHKRGRLVYEPLGVAGVISPWNLPFGIPMSNVASVVAAGNAAVVKPSELTPLSGAWVERVFAEAGAPRGLVRVVQGEADVGDALVRAPAIAKVVFTGSAPVGRLVAAAAGERLCPVTLELGGKDPMLVFGDADLARAVEGALFGSFLNAGQICVSVERIYVERPRYDAFVSALAERARSLRLGDELGPLISERARAKVESLVEDAVAHGAEVVTGGAAPARDGWFYEPTVLAGDLRGARIEHEEVFGPVVTVQPFEDEAQAVGLANASPFGLGASVWTGDAARGRRVAARLEAGMVWVNDAAYSYAASQTPWGGTKESGFGRTHGKHGLYEVSQVKYVDTDAGRLRDPWWYPYDDAAADGFRGALGMLYGDGLPARASAAWRHRRGLVALGRRSLKR